MEKVCNVFIFVILMLQPLSSIYADNKNNEAQVLMDIKNQLKGTEDCMPEWIITGNPCNWTSIHCDESYYVDGINLSETTNCKELEGVLADFAEGLADLTHLEYLIISNTKISGQIPDSIGKLANLDQLDLSSNKLNGIIPSDLGNLNNLGLIDLSNNNLTGNIPSAMGTMKELKSMYLSNNSLSGEIPLTIWTNMISFYNLDLSNNNLTGNIPCNISYFDGAKINFQNNPELKNSTC